MTDGNRTSPNQRWISFVNASGEVIPPYGVLWVKPLTDAWEDIDNADRVESSIKWKVYKPEFPTLAELMADPGGIDYPILLAINSSSEVAADSTATGLMTFATDGPAWMAVYGPGDLTETAYARYAEGSPIGPSHDNWKGVLGGIGFRTVRLMDLTSGRRRVLVMADHGPYEMRLISPGVYGSKFGDQSNVADDMVPIDPNTQGPFPIGACTPHRFADAVFVQDTGITKPIYPVHFDRQSMLYVASDSESSCEHTCIKPNPTVIAQTLSMNNAEDALGRTGRRLTAGLGMGQNIFMHVPVRLGSTNGADEVQLGCYDETAGTVQADNPDPDVTLATNDGDFVDVVWTGCKALITNVYSTCAEEV